MEGVKVETPVMPRIGDDATDFEAVTTHGKKKLSDYKGKCKKSSLSGNFSTLFSENQG